MYKKYKTGLLIFSKIIGILPKKLLLFFWDISSVFSGSINIALRYCLIKSLANSCGENVYIGKFVTIKNFEHLNLGDNISIHDFSYIEAKGGLTINNNVSIAHNASILTSSHNWNDITLPIKYNEVTFNPVLINEDVWIGCGVRVLNGTTIGSRSIIAAGSIVNKDVDANTIVAGVPIKKIKEID
ncbi:acyltransferase [Planococcus sp. ISL-109]|uniref:acyltransferase n=1 Tax=Planococcus sp. ISL-109 TaxID=2819166 RepID=UPI001BE5BEF3|nr:acyltransferase [Planococcus sp. ISL-109]MBT2581231.1 acyltransferase [Planococcus sp. ISL-109]